MQAKEKIMNAQYQNVTSAFDRLNPLLTWWRIPNANGNESIEGQVKRFQIFGSDLQQAYGEAYSYQMGSLFTANEQLARSLQNLLHCRQPGKVIVVESDILAIFFEGAMLQAKTWVDLTQRVQECYAAAREAMEDVRKHAKQETETKPTVQTAQVSNRDKLTHA
jgi:hypothetical protein